MVSDTRFVTVANMKGGAGKTTTAVCTAMALARLGYRVEVRDIDPQGSATQWAANARHAGRPLPFEVTVANRFTVGDRPMDPTVEWVLVDTPTGLADLIAAGVDASDLVMVVTPPGVLDLERMRQTVDAVNRPSSVLLTQTRAHTRTLRQAVEYLDGHGLACFATTIPYMESLRRAPDTGVFPSATNYGLVARELVDAFDGREG